VAAGVGVSIVSRAAVKDQVALQRLKMIEIAGVAIERTLWQLTVSGRLSIPAADVFKKIIAPNTPVRASTSSRRTKAATKN
jgi:DNA-binding transcriptional LysR family regulator